MDKNLVVNGATVHYTDRMPVDGRPDAPVIVLMHGWGCNISTLASIEAVALESRRVINIDFPGHGLSPDPPEVWGIELYTQVLEAIIKRERIERISLLGHSFGGRVALLYSSRHDNVDQLILVDAAGIKPRRTLKYYYKVYTYKLMKKMLYALLGKAKAEKKLDERRRKAGSSDYANATPRMRAILSRVVNEDLRHVMPSIKADTLLIWGEADTATPPADARYMETHIANAALVSFPNCGHYSFLDNPAQFAAVLRSYLNSLTDKK